MNDLEQVRTICRTLDSWLKDVFIKNLKESTISGVTDVEATDYGYLLRLEKGQEIELHLPTVRM